MSGDFTNTSGDSARADNRCSLRECVTTAIEKEASSRGLAFGAREWAVLALDIDLNGQGLAVAAELTRRLAHRGFRVGTAFVGQ